MTGGEADTGPLPPFLRSSAGDDAEVQMYNLTYPIVEVRVSEPDAV